MSPTSFAFFVSFLNGLFADLVFEQLLASITELSDEGLGLVLGIGSHWSHFFIARHPRWFVES